MPRRPALKVALLCVAAGAAAALLVWQPWLSPLERVTQEARPTGVKVLLLGIDGATFRVMDPLLEERRLPSFARLVEHGVRAPLRSENPMASPALWTTIATGRKRADHGIQDFLIRSPGRKSRGRLVAASDRRTLALWNLASAFGRRVGFLGWWASWPAEPVNGWIVSDRLTRDRWVEWTGGRRDADAVYPASLAASVRPLVVDPDHPPIDEILALARFTDAERAELQAARKPVFGHGLSVLKYAWCSQRSYEAMALALLPRGQPDLTGVFLVANDPVCHTFWHLYDPAAFKGVDPKQAERLGPIVPALYEHNDRFLAALQGVLDPATVVIVVSDHGFTGSGQLPAERPALHLFEGPEAEKAREAGMIARGQSGQHQLDGVFIAAGGPIRPGAVARQPTLYDVTPTVLALLGLPVAADMPGRVLEEILDPGFLAAHEVRRIPSYEGLVPRAASRPDLAGGDAGGEKEDLLRSLGYIQ